MRAFVEGKGGLRIDRAAYDPLVLAGVGCAPLLLQGLPVPTVCLSLFSGSVYTNTQGEVKGLPVLINGEGLAGCIVGSAGLLLYHACTQGF